MAEKDKIINVLYLYSSPRGLISEQNNFHTEQTYAFYGCGQLQQYNINSFYSDKGFEQKQVFFSVLSSIVEKFTGIYFEFNQIFVLRKFIQKADIIFATTQHCGIPVALLKYLGIVKKPIVLTSIGLPEKYKTLRKRFGKILFLKILKTVERFICYGWKEKGELLQHLDIPSGKIIFIPFGVDTEYFKPMENAQKDYILSIGADVSRDYKTLFDAVKDLKVDISVITFQRNINGLTVPPNVHVFFEVPFKEIREYYAGARFVVLPLRENSYSGGTTSLLQAMAMGKAVIVSRVGAIIDGYDLQDRVNCLFAKPGDTRALQEAILFLLNNPEDCERIGKQARETVERYFRWNTYVLNLSKVFRMVYEQYAKNI